MKFLMVEIINAILYTENNERGKPDIVFLEEKKMKNKKFLAIASVLAASALSLGLMAGCGAKEPTSVTFEAEDAKFFVNGSESSVSTVLNSVSGESAVYEDGAVKYVRVYTYFFPTDDTYTLQFNFNSDKEAEATITFKMAAPIVCSQGTPDYLGTATSAMYTLKVNGVEQNTEAWDDSIGEAYDALSESLNWVDVSLTTTLKEGANTIELSTLNAGVDYGMMFYITDTPCVDNVTITSTATITK